MRICVPTEVKNNEYRVALAPAGVPDLVLTGADDALAAGVNTARRDVSNAGVAAAHGLPLEPISAVN